MKKYWTVILMTLLYIPSSVKLFEKIGSGIFPMLGLINTVAIVVLYGYFVRKYYTNKSGVPTKLLLVHLTLLLTYVLIFVKIFKS